jgi:hypothetical protein
MGGKVRKLADAAIEGGQEQLLPNARLARSILT